MTAHAESHQRHVSVMVTYTGNPQKKDRAEDSAGDRSRNLKLPSPSSCCFSLSQIKRVLDAQGWRLRSTYQCGSLLFLCYGFYNKIYNKQKMLALAFKSGTPSVSHRTACFQKSPLFTLQQSLLYARPPLRQSPAQPCITPLASHRFQVFLHCFPCFGHSMTRQSISN